MCVDAEREKSRDRRRPSRRSDKETEEKERKDNIERQRRKTSPSQDEKNEEKTEKEDMAKDESSPGFKVKTLEEILREKALKKLEERRAQAKIEEQKEAEDGKEEREEENMGKGEGANKSEEEESVVLESESNAKHLFDEKDSNSVEPSFEKPSVARKVSLNEKKRSPVKKVVGLKKNFIDSKSSSTAEMDNWLVYHLLMTTFQPQSRLVSFLPDGRLLSSSYCHLNRRLLPFKQEAYWSNSCPDLIFFLKLSNL